MPIRMNAADFLVIIVLAVTLVLGTVRGFMREAIALLAWLGGLWLAWRYADLLKPFLGGLLAQEPQRTWVSRAAILSGVILFAWIVGGVLSYFVHQSGLSVSVDRFLGGLFGALRGLTLIALVAMLAQVVRLNEVKWWKNSELLPYAESVSHWIGGFAESAEDSSVKRGKG
jgi:membrane protein required for colicin V production